MTVLALVALLAAGAPAAPRSGPGQATRPRLAVIDLAANGASKELASATGGVVATELDRLGAFQVITSDAIRDLLAFEKQKQMLGCAEARCFADLGDALGADYLVSGKVTRLPGSAAAPETLSLELTLTAARSGQREGSVIESARTESELVARVGRAVGRLVAKVLAGRAGALVVTATEAGAVVKVDDQVRGTSPLPGQLAVPAGVHLLTVEKQGFVAFQKEVQIQAAAVTEERVTLVPSPDFIRDYESRQRKVRLGAWIATGVAAAGTAGAILLQVDANRLYGTDSTPGTFLFARRKLVEGIELDPASGVDYRAQANSLRSQVTQRERLSAVSAGLAGAGAVAAAWLWIVGDDPGRYARYRELPPVAVLPLPAGAMASLTLAF